jgi:hypothetical protein
MAIVATQGDGPRRLGKPVLWAAGLVAPAVAGLAIALVPLESLQPLVLVASLAALVGALSAIQQRSLIFVGTLFYIGVLHWVYVDWVAPFYSYSGVIASGVDWPALLFITILSALPAAWLPTKLTRPSDVVLWFLYLFGYVPASAIPIHLLGPELWPILPFSVVLAVAFATLGVIHRIPLAPLTWSGLSERGFSRLLVAIGIVVVGYLVVVFGIPTGLPDFETVYDARAGYSAIANVTVGAGYIVPWAGNVIFPFLIAYGLARSRIRLLMFGVSGELLVYATTGFKTVLFSIVLVPLLYVIVRYARRSFGALLAWGGVAVIGISVAATWISGSIWPLALFVTRLLAVPGQMTAYYYDFFSSHSTYELSRSFLRWLIPAPFDVDPPYLIGAVYLNDASIDANANIWADAMANYGLVGIVPFTLVLGGVLWLLDSIAAQRDLLVVGPTLGLAGITLGNGALFTSILTLGIGLTIVFVVLMPRIRGETVDAGGMPHGP